MDEKLEELPLSCPQCGAGLTAVHKVKIDTVSSMGNRDLPIGDRTDIVTMRCPHHGEVARRERVTPAGHPMDSIVDDMLAPLRAALASESRWHEIATEGLPPRGERVLLLNSEAASGDAVAFIGSHADGVWFDGTLDVIELFDDERQVATHWHPLPAPPTKEPR